MTSVTWFQFRLVTVCSWAHGAEACGQTHSPWPLTTAGPPWMVDVNRNDNISTLIIRSVAGMSINYTNFHQVHEMKTGQILSKCFLSLSLFSSGETCSTGISYCTLGKKGETEQWLNTVATGAEKAHTWWGRRLSLVKKLKGKAPCLAHMLHAEPSAWGAFCCAALRLCSGCLCPAVASPVGRGLTAPLFWRQLGGAGGLSERHQEEGEVRCKTGSKWPQSC